MLSSQTKDEVTDAAVDKLRKTLGGTLSLEAVLTADESTISEAINKVGFWRKKTQFSPLLFRLYYLSCSLSYDTNIASIYPVISVTAATDSFTELQVYQTKRPTLARLLRL